MGETDSKAKRAHRSEPSGNVDSGMRPLAPPEGGASGTGCDMRQGRSVGSWDERERNRGTISKEARVFPPPLLLRMAREGIPVTVQEGGATLDECLRYSNHHCTKVHSHVVLEKINKGQRQRRILIFPRGSARKIRGLRVSPLGAVISPEELRVIHDLTFDLSEENRRGGVDARIPVDDSLPCLCPQALPTLLRELVKLRRRYPKRRILLSKRNSHDAFRNMRINPYNG